MGANDVRAGGAYVEIGAVSKGLENALNRAAGRLKAFGASVSSIGTKMAALGAIVTAPLIAAANAGAQAGAAMYDMSRRTGISVESLSTLGFAAKMSGASLDELEPAIKRMQKTIGGVADSTEGTTGSLEHLGIAMESIRGKAPDEQFRLIAEALNKISDPTERASAAMKVFGRSGTDILPMVSQLGDLEATAQKLGLVKSTESAKNAKEYAQMLLLVEIAVKKVWGALSAGIIPILKQKAESVARITLRLAEWIKANKSTVVTIFQVATAVGVAGVGLIFLGKAIGLVGVAVGGVSSLFSVFRGVIGNAATILTTVLTSGIGLVIAGLIGLGAYLLYNSQVGQQALGALGEYFGQLKDTATAAFQGIKNALAAGDWRLAAEILWLGIKVAFAQGIAPLMSMWDNFKAFFVKTAVGAFDGFLAAWDIGRNFLAEGWIKTVSMLSTVWATFMALVRKGWEAAVHLWNDTQITNNDKLSDVQRTEAFAAEAKRHREATGGIDKDQMDAITAANQKERDALKSESDRHHDALLKAGEHYNAMAAGADAQAKAEVEADKKKKAALEAELNAATKKAKAEAAGVKPKDSLLPKLPEPKLPGAADINQAIVKAIAVAGTFNAFGARGLGQNSAADRTAKATEQTAKTLDKIYGRGGAPGLKFK